MVSVYPFEMQAEAMEEASDELLRLYAQPTTFVECRQSVRALWEWRPDLLVGVLAWWWESTRVTDEQSLVFDPAALLGERGPDGVAVSFSLSMVRGEWETGRRYLREYLREAAYQDMCELAEVTAELVLSVRAEVPQ